MSKNAKKLNLIKNAVKVKRNSQFIKRDLIKYNENQFNTGFFKLMKAGYEEMAKISLELSQLLFEYECADINGYENWLCGV